MNLIQQFLEQHRQGVVLTPELLRSTLSREQMLELAQQLVEQKKAVKQVQQLELYRPASQRCIEVHVATDTHVIVTAGNRAGKTDTNLADLVICMTGIVPWSLEDIYPKSKLLCPMRARIVCESLTNTWAPVIRPKLQWDKWNGRGDVGGEFGHWGWIPQRFLRRGKWDDSWSEKERTLTLTCGCTLQITSYDQDVQDFSGSSLHRVVFDEAPPADIYRENLMRIADTNGQLYFGFTPPDDPGKAMRGSWIYELYEKGLPGPGKDPAMCSIQLYTEENKVVDAVILNQITAGLTPAQRETRLRGAFMHLTGRIYPQYTDVPRCWCFTCNEPSMVKDDACLNCAGINVVEYCNLVKPFDMAYTWPVVFLLDPHPRKANMMSWVAIDPCDDWWQIGEMAIDGDPVMVNKHATEFERDHGLNICRRIIDPNMAEQAAHNAGRRQVSVRDEFDAVGLRCSLPSDSFSVGMKRLRERFHPDARTKAPRLHIFNTCQRTNKQIKNYVWGERGRDDGQHEAKAVPIDKEDDYPTLLKYLANEEPSFRTLSYGNQPIYATRRRQNKSRQQEMHW